MVKTTSGGTPTPTSVPDVDWEIYRAYTSLADAENGTENTGLGVDIDSWSGGRDLVTNNEQWNVICYADAADSGGVLFNDDWITSSHNYLKIYTPVTTAEVGTTQRHSGIWNAGRFNINRTTTSTFQAGISMNAEFVWLEGLQINLNYGHDECFGIGYSGVDADSLITLNNNIIKGNASAAGINGIGIRGNSPAAKIQVYNNIVYNFINTDNSDGTGIGAGGNADSRNQKHYNNTVYGCYDGYYDTMWHGGDVINNLSYNNFNEDFRGVYGPESDYNFSKDDSAPGANSIHGDTDTLLPVFNNVGAGTEDFHLQVTSDAVGKGFDLNSIFTIDIDGVTRTATFDIGADQE